MSFIHSRKKIVSHTILSTLSVISVGQAFAEDSVIQLPVINVAAEQVSSVKIDNSANAKYVAPLLDTPKSVSVISQKLIEDTNVTTLSDALRTVPGITLGAGEGGNPNGDRPFIRGYSSESSLYVDGVRNATSQSREMFAVEQVEVTKGSASALGGAGSSGGSINLVSKVAKKGDSLQGSISQGTDDYRRIVLDGNKDFGNGIAARIVAMGHENNKAGQDNGAEYKRAGIAPSIIFGLDTATRATLSYYYLKSDDIPDSGVPYNNPNTYAKGSGEPIDVKQGIYYGWKDRDFQKQENQIGTIKLEHDFNDNLTLTNTSIYSKSKNNYVWTQPDDSQGNFINATTGQLQDKGIWRRSNSSITSADTFTDQLALTGKFSTGTINHRFNTGVEYSKLESDKGSYTLASTTGKSVTGAITNGACTLGLGAASDYWCTSTFNPNSNDPWLGSITANPNLSTTTAKTTSVYVLDSIEFTPQWLLDLGVRWDKFETDLKTHATGVTVSSDSDFFSYQSGITFKPTENGSIYASFSTAANPVGIDAGNGSESAVSATIKDLDPEKSRTYEIGTKWDLLDNHLNATAAIFRTEKQNARVQLSPTEYANIGESRIDGIELGLNGQITDAWMLSLGYTYLDSEIIDAGNTCGRNATVCTAGNASDGKQMANVPKNSATLWTTYQLLPQLTLGGGVTYMDKVFGNTTNTKWVPSYVRYDLMTRYSVNPNVDLQLNVNNLSDERYFTKAYSSHFAAEAEGRSAVLSLNFNY